ncbi:hypothetical protein SAMN04488168_111123 [Bacillus sp. 491mf]|uniref:hypothetical protein n=1 Tax=unclassified Bacillus (in: firmicutes) TaxID=185979 RepID=UPI00055429AC|nr:MULTISPECIES: hypothetical protein [unclassified Bacillus (in: firmicutes)]SFC89825.1 hypothetical protein SAMN04488168_111123 [Bacillus sp. 491mf]
MYWQSNGQYQYNPYHHQYNYPYMLDKQPFPMDSRQGCALTFDTRIRDMGQHTLADHKRAIVDKLRQKGFSGVVLTRSEVAGNKGGCRVSITHLQRTGAQYWEVVMCSCPTSNQANITLKETLTAIHSIVFFD